MRSARINAPTIQTVDPRYIDLCKFALDPSFARLVDMAVEAGWSRQRVLYSLMFMAAEKAQGDIAEP
jgi:hypothetical protein